MKIWFLPQFIAWRSEVSLRYEFYYQPALDRTLDFLIVNNIRAETYKVSDDKTLSFKLSKTQLGGLLNILEDFG